MEVKDKEGNQTVEKSSEENMTVNETTDVSILRNQITTTRNGNFIALLKMMC